MTLRSFISAALTVIVLLAGAANVARAVTAVFWQVSTQAEFLRGEADDVSVDAAGRILLGPNAETVHETTAPFVWSLVATEDAVWVGSGDDGRVARLESDGSVADTYDLDGLNAYALVDDGAEGVVAATAPDGAVVAISADGNRTVLFDPEESYVWAMARAPDGDLYVGTGDPGRVYRLDSSNGTETLLYDTGAAHVRALAVDPDGRVIAGTSGPGHVMRIDADGRGFVLLDTEYDEITALRALPDGGVLVVAASKSVTDNGTTNGATTTATTTTATASTAPTASTATSVNASPVTATVPLGTQGAVYRIAPDGIWDVLWDSSEDTPYDALPERAEAAGSVDGFIIATGPAGKIYRVDADGSPTILLTRAPAKQVTRLTRTDGGTLYYAASNPGVIARLVTNRTREGTYLSQVHDAGTVATWGAVRWDAATPSNSEVAVSTRSGNTAVPGDTWSEWSTPYAEPGGSAITSPNARYLQWRAVLRGDSETPVLRAVTAAYLPRNLSPEVTELTVHPPGQVFQQAFASGDPPIAGLDVSREPPATPTTNGETPATTLGRQVYRKGLRTFVWKARDLNSDQLAFDVLYRLDDGDDDEWRSLKQASTATIFTWDTSAVPDGTYVVRIVATDAVSNTPDTVLSGTRDSGPVIVDNTPPQIAVEPPPAGAGDVAVSFTVGDTLSPVDHVEYSVDTETWQILYPVDGIADSREEQFTVSVPAELASRLVVRATDAMDNTATAGVAGR